MKDFSELDNITDEELHTSLKKTVKHLALIQKEIKKRNLKIESGVLKKLEYYLEIDTEYYSHFDGHVSERVLDKSIQYINLPADPASELKDFSIEINLDNFIDGNYDHVIKYLSELDTWDFIVSNGNLILDPKIIRGLNTALYKNDNGNSELYTGFDCRVILK